MHTQVHNAIVTGGARGLGAAVVDRVRSDGGAACVVDIIDAPEVDCVGDVSNPAFVDSAVAHAFDLVGPIDLVVNCAGINGPLSSALDIAVEDFRRVIDVNLVGTFLVARAAARVMVDQGVTGVIVNISSLVAQQAVPGLVSYAAAKGAVTLITQTMALDLARYGIRVNTIAPGHIMSDLHMGYLTRVAAERGTSVAEEQEQVRASVPLGRHGTGADIAGTIMWLASDDASYVTGQTIAVNGGVYLS
jgi:NAD(P)-dependent dehydrogenase (short-subunit alcohol dehydrogenase family)